MPLFSKKIFPWQPSTEAPLQRVSRTDPLPEGMDEMDDRNLSGGAAPGHNDGKGGHGVKGNDDKKGFGALPGPPEQKEALAKGDIDIAERGEPGLQTTQGSSK